MGLYAMNIYAFYVLVVGGEREKGFFMDIFQLKNVRNGKIYGSGHVFIFQENLWTQLVHVISDRELCW